MWQSGYFSCSFRDFSRRRLLTALACVAPWSVFGVVARAEDNPGFKVIVNPEGSTQAETREFLTDVFLKRVVRWRNGDAVKPVDQRADAAQRHRFSESVLRRSVASVRNYWQQQIFSGRGVPPPELDSDGAVVKYVVGHRGAVGYVASSTDTAKVRVLHIL